MANAFTYRHGPRKPVIWAVLSATVIEVGDMVYGVIDSDSAEVKPASDFTWDTNLATTQGSFAAQFVGIAMESSASGQTDPISIDTSSNSVYEMTVPSGTYYQGDMFGPDEDSSSLKDQVLEKVSTSAAAIARYAEKDNSSRGTTTSLRVTFAPAYVTDSANVNANVG